MQCKNSPRYATYRDQVIEALSGISSWKALSEALLEGREFVDWLSGDKAAAITEITCQEGYAPHPQLGESHPIAYQAYLNHVINPLILREVIHDGSKPGTFDDRKVRWSNTTLENLVDADGKRLRLSVGPTYYSHCQRDIHRDPIEALQLMLAGLQVHNDPYAYFARGIGVVLILLTREGHAFIGKRSRGTDYCEALSFVSGWASFSSNVAAIDFYQDLDRELQEELFAQSMIQPDRLRFVGLSGHPTTAEVDLVFALSSDLADSHFESGNWPEHSDWYAIRCRADAEQLLETGRIGGIEESLSLMYSSHFGLEFLINNYWRT